jgi:RNA polymerase sigma-70 factor (ECF subfamily)
MTQATNATALCGEPGVADIPQRNVDAAAAAARADRLRLVVCAHYASLWRFLRRLGVHPSAAEDAAQQVLCVVARRIDEVQPEREKAFLFGVALRVARTVRREQKKRLCVAGDEVLAQVPDPTPEAGDGLDDQRARDVLDALLEAMPLDLRTVFVLYEIDEMTMADIALALAIPPGTVASRLRRAREAFTALSRRAQARAAACPARRKP